MAIIHTNRAAYLWTCALGLKQFADALKPSTTVYSGLVTALPVLLSQEGSSSPAHKLKVMALPCTLIHAADNSKQSSMKLIACRAVCCEDCQLVCMLKCLLQRLIPSCLCGDHILLQHTLDSRTLSAQTVMTCRKVLTWHQQVK